MSAQILKPGWKMVKFGEVVHQVKDRVDRDETGLKHYLGGEHFNKVDIHVKGKGVIAENPIGPAFHMRFKPGHVLIVSRNPHLRKAAIAEFEGICANTTYVCEADGKNLLPELLPFLMQTDVFWSHAEANKRGSTNPYLNWSDFARFEFPLPPIEEQKRITKILWAADEAAEKYRETLSKFESFVRCQLEQTLDSLNCREMALPKVLSGSPESGCSAPPSPHETGHWVLSLAALSASGYLRGNLKPVNRTDKMLNARLSKGDLLISRSNTVDLVGFAGIFDEDRTDVSFPDTMMRLPLNTEKVLPQYLELILLSNHGRKHMMRTASGTSNSMKKINRKTLSEFRFPVPDLEVQEQIISTFSLYKAHLDEINNHLAKMLEMLFALSNVNIGAAHV